MANIESNIWKMYVIEAASSFMTIMPIIVLFYQENGLSMYQILLLQSLFSIALLLFEVPSGYFSDVVGRKPTLIISAVFWFLGICIYSISNTFYGFLAAELALAVGSSFMSGTDSAILYDTLLQVKRKKDYKKVEGRIFAIGSGSHGIASILGGLLAVISLRAPFYLQNAVVFIAIPTAFWLVEPMRRKKEQGSLRTMFRIAKHALHDHHEIKWLILYSGIVSTSTLTMVWLIQPYLKSAGLPLILFGVIWAACSFSVSGFSLMANWLESKVGKRKSLLSLLVLVVIGYILLSTFQAVWAIGFFFLFFFVRGFHEPIVKDYLNKLIRSSERATILSVRGLVSRLMWSITGPFIGWMVDAYTLSAALAACAVLFLFTGLIALLFLQLNRVI